MMKANADRKRRQQFKTVKEGSKLSHRINDQKKENQAMRFEQSATLDQ